MRFASGVLLALAIGTLIWGCDWLPVRDNTTDQQSPYYLPPLPVNHAPVIDSMAIVTDCKDDPFSRFCWFEVRAFITDVDRNILLDSVTCRVELAAGQWYEFGQLSYQPEQQWFALRVPQNVIPGGQLESLYSKPLRVDVEDAAGDSATAALVFPLPLLDFPTIVEPSSGQAVNTHHPALRWIVWHSPVGRHSYAVNVLWLGFVSVWDTAGLGAATDSVVVGDSLWDNSFGDTFYTWELTVTDSGGSSATAVPADFRVLIPGP
jgi:hypothetical protein